MRTYPLIVGSKNPIKIQAVRDVVERDSRLRHISAVEGLAVPSAVSPQPRSLRETTLGALHRAHAAASSPRGHGAGVGIESGVFTVRQINGSDLVFDTTSCAIMLPGQEIMIGFCPAWQIPADIRDAIEDGLEMDEAFFATKRTTNSDLGEAEGATGLLSKGRMTRLAYTVMAIEAALLTWEG